MLAKTFTIYSRIDPEERVDGGRFQAGYRLRNGQCLKRSIIFILCLVLVAGLIISCKAADSGEETSNKEALGSLAPTNTPKDGEAPDLKTAYMVIAGGDKDKDAAEIKLKQYKNKLYPYHGEYPKLLNSSDILGLNPGYWIVVAAVSQDKDVAEELNRFLRILGGDAYVRKVKVKDPEDLRLFVIGASEAISEDMPARGQTAYFKLRERSESQVFAPERGLSVCAEDGYTVIPYTTQWQGSELHLICDAVESFHKKWRSARSAAVCNPRNWRFENTNKRILKVQRVDCFCGLPDAPP